MKQTIYKWKITHPEYGTVETTGPSKYEAVIAAAKIWRVPWSSVARACTFEKIGEVPGA